MTPSVFEQAGVKVSRLAQGNRAWYPKVRVDERGLWLGDELTLARADIASVVVELGERTTVMMRTQADVLERDGAYRAKVGGQPRGYCCTFTSAADAEALLRALGRERQRTVTEIALEPSLLRAGFDELPLWRAFLQTLIAMITLTVIAPLLLRPGPALAPLGTLLDARLELGADGVRVRSRLANVFVAYREVRAVSTRDNVIVLTLADGRTSALKPVVSARIPEIMQQIERAIASATAPATDEIAERLHEVAGTKPEQLRGLRELGSEIDGSYRASTLPRDRLWALVEDDAVEHATRSRAAAALSGSLASPERERLRIAADATVGPKLRVALAAVQAEDDALLAEQLEELPEAKHARPRPDR